MPASSTPAGNTRRKFPLTPSPQATFSVGLRRFVAETRRVFGSSEQTAATVIRGERLWSRAARHSLRKQWLAAAGFVLIYTMIGSLQSDFPSVQAPFGAVIYGIAALVVVRFGLMALAAGIFVADLLGSLPATGNFLTECAR